MNIVHKILRRLRYELLRHINPVMVGGYRTASGTFLPHTRISTSSFIDHPENLVVEDYVFIGHHNFIEASDGLTIEEGCQITNFVSITTHSSHNSIRLYGREYVSMVKHMGYVRGSIFIGKYSFIGPHSLIMPGTRIGKGSIVSAYSLVQGEFPDFSILKGNPAIVVGDTRDKDSIVLKDHPELVPFYSDWPETVYPMTCFLKKYSDSFGNILFIMVLGSILLLPGIQFPGLWFKLRFEDFLLPLIAVFLILKKPVLKNAYIYVIGLYGLIILFSIFINRRYTFISDYFELYKLFKYLMYALFFSLTIDVKRLYATLRIIFALLFLFNILHYFNVFGFNEHVMPLYSNGLQLEFFGLNSLGEPAARRLLGSMGNPNMNAIIMIFFFLIFLTKENKSFGDRLVMYASFALAVACQSRTGFVALGAVYVGYLIMHHPPRKTILRQIPSFVALILIVPLIDKFGLAYLNSMTHSAVMETSSVQGRLAIWKHLWEMIQLKPFFGHAPYKEYFYENHLYPESEYVLITWRYGFVGLSVFLMVLSFPTIQLIRKLWKNEYGFVILFTVLIAISSLTNNPFSEPRSMLLIAFMAGWFLAVTKEKSTFVQDFYYQ